MKTFIALLSVSLIALAVAQYGTGVYPTSTTNASVSTWTTGCAYVTSWTSTPPFAYCGGCATGYFQNTAQSNCTAISPAGCAAISSNNTCLAALPGYYLASGVPTACPTSLIGAAGGTCTSASTVTTCAPGFWLSSGTATACTPCTYNTAALSGCTQCDPSGSGVCISVGAAASVAGTTATSPTSATPGFIANCFVTSGTASPVTCTTPNPGYYGSVPTAATPITGCLQYSGATTCSKAALGYTYSSGTVSVCTTVTASSTCSGAASGYYVSSTSIVALPTGVATGTASANYTCIAGYYLTQTGLCVSGTLTDPHCAIANSTSVCVGCQAGYNFTTNLTCGACGTNCGTCTNSSICTACSNTTLYTLNSNGTCTNKTSSANILAPSFAILSMIFYYLF
jgi:proprotein convertase subtilisin/kexin type 5